MIFTLRICKLKKPHSVALNDQQHHKIFITTTGTIQSATVWFLICPVSGDRILMGRPYLTRAPRAICNPSHRELQEGDEVDYMHTNTHWSHTISFHSGFIQRLANYESVLREKRKRYETVYYYNRKERWVSRDGTKILLCFSIKNTE